MDNMNDSKINKLQQALGDSTGTGLNLRPSLDPNAALPNKDGQISLNLGNKFDGQQLGHDPKNLKDPKGINKQVLKGNAKARRH